MRTLLLMLPIVQIDKTIPALIVEDEVFIAAEIEQMLFDFGFENVEVCLSFAEAAERVEKHTYGLTIFDVNVGGMLSYGLISDAISRGCAVITMSGYVSQNEAIEGRVFLAKPIDPKALINAIAKAYNWRVKTDVGAASKAAG